MRVAVVTPYCREPIEKLNRCHRSVRAQTCGCVDHFDYGDTPRIIGTSSAATQRYDAIALLDADNWFRPDHIETLLERQRESRAEVVTCARMLMRQDGTELGLCTQSDGEQFNDMNCFLIMRNVFAIFRSLSYKDPASAIVDDRILWKTIVDVRLPRVHSAQPTVFYETTFADHYLERGEEPPENSKYLVPVGDGNRRLVFHRDRRRGQGPDFSA